MDTFDAVTLGLDSLERAWQWGDGFEVEFANQLGTCPKEFRSMAKAGQLAKLTKFKVCATSGTTQDVVGLAMDGVKGRLVAIRTFQFSIEHQSPGALVGSGTAIKRLSETVQTSTWCEAGHRT